MLDFDALPYELHTGRELDLMLRGLKPLAVFVDEYPPESREEIIPAQRFHEHVLRGAVDKREYVELLSGSPPANQAHLKGLRRVLYALPGESWRIDAYIEMLATAHAAGWSEAMERLEGRLLGYEDWQIDAWLAFLLARPHAKHFPWLMRLAEARRQQAASADHSAPAGEPQTSRPNS